MTDNAVTPNTASASQTVKMSLAGILLEIKRLDERILKASSNKPFISLEYAHRFMPARQDKFKAYQANWQSAIDLIKRQETLRGQLAQANATTDVVIAGQKMTIAQAIKLKESIRHYDFLLQNAARQLSKAQLEYQTAKSRLDSDAQQLRISRSSGEGVMSQEQIDSETKDLFQQNEKDLVDPVDLEKEIEKYQTWVMEFRDNVDLVLNAANVTTHIDVPM